MNEDLAYCAKINFENLAADLPLITGHPFWKIAKAQLDEALGGPRVEDVLKVQLDNDGRLH